MVTIRIKSVKDFDTLLDLAQAASYASIVPRGEEIFFDLTDVEFAQPNFVAVLAGLANLLRHQEKRFKCQPPENPGCFQFLVDVGLLGNFIPFENGRVQRGDPGAVKLAEFRGADPTLIQDVSDKFMEHIGGIPDLIGRLEQAFGELMDNVYAHSESPVGGVLSGQYYPNAHKLSLAVCDYGISIPVHLGRVPRFSGLPDHVLLERAFDEGVTGSGTGRYGSGLPFIKELTESLGGWVKVYSRGATCTLNENWQRADPVTVPFPGTLIVIDWKTR